MNMLKFLMVLTIAVLLFGPNLLSRIFKRNINKVQESIQGMGIVETNKLKVSTNSNKLESKVVKENTQE